MAGLCALTGLPPSEVRSLTLAEISAMAKLRRDQARAMARGR
jgi:integrase